MSMRISAVDFFTRLGKTNVLNKNKQMPAKLSFKGSDNDPQPMGEGHFETTLWDRSDWPEEIPTSGAGYDVKWVPYVKPSSWTIPGS